MKTVHARIKGRVQGVFFRDYTRRKAEKLSLKGWVRNEPDGTVGAVFQGSESDIEKMIEWLDEGSPQANVTGVQVQECYDGHRYKDFQVH
ncbi:acylphosphatase [Desulfopila inferna]|uniref:acylphosphatase n=1 Tax=Desulfopila inferna TaxID=468528 RepID=UPI001963818D|nr:acylphosphatase [Desulfopila inferna]MBM9602624.1 acylphosphatase [Desulfopila inferna]